MGFSQGNSYKAIIASVKNNLLVEYNTVDTTGYVGIEFQGSNVTVRNNVVNYFDYIKEDGGGIYTWVNGTDAAPGPVYTNRVVSNNIVMNGIGAADGKPNNGLFATGIYLDGRTMNVQVLNNTVFNNSKNGIHMNNPGGITLRGNTSYNNLNAMSMMRYAYGSITNLVMKENILFPVNNTQRHLYYTNAAINSPAVTTVQQALMALGDVDSNRYSTLNPLGFNFEIYATEGGAAVPCSPASFDGWQLSSGHDLNSSKPAKMPADHKINAVIGTNKYANGMFNTNISGITVWGGDITSGWDNTNKINGGSLKITFNAPRANRYNLMYAAVGAISGTKQYILRFSTYGTTDHGIVKAFIRKTASPYYNLVATQTKVFGMGRTDHEFLFNAPISEAAGSLVISLEENSGVTYVDNIEFYEASFTLYDAASQLRFEYNRTLAPKTVELDGNYVGIDGQSYTGAVTLQPLTSLIMIRDTAGVHARPNAPAAAKLFAENIPAVQQPAIKVYPNPSSGDFNLDTRAIEGSNVAVTVFSAGGTLVYRNAGAGGRIFTFGNDFAPGVYIVKIFDGKRGQSLKIIKGLK